MATTYLIELRLNQPDMLLFLEHARMFKSSIKAIPEEQPIAAEDMKLAPEPIYKTTRTKKEHARRAKRGSKVIDAILGTMESGGPVHVSALKQALEKAGMSPSSLSTGLAQLQKSGAIQRDGEGMYLLTAHEGVAA